MTCTLKPIFGCWTPGDAVVKMAVILDFIENSNFFNYGENYDC